MGRSDYKTKVRDASGHFTVVEPNNGIMEFVHMEYIRLQDKQTCIVGRKDRELCIAVMSGGCTVKYGKSSEKITGREHLFNGLPHAIYVPPEKIVEICADGFFEAIIWGTPAVPKGNVEFVRPGDLKILNIGVGNWAIQGYFLIGSDFPAQTLIVGETQIPAGNWCSVPPHSHEKNIPGVETKLEEIYYFRFYPETGFGFQGLYTDDRELDDAYIIRNHDVILVPRGYHPNVPGPGYQMRMMWGMGGLERNWIPYEDPDHSWVGKGSYAPSNAAWDK